MNPPANWYPDPTGRHGQRYWDGEQWTEHVFTDGVQGVDPLDAADDDRQQETDAQETDAQETDAQETDAEAGEATTSGAGRDDAGSQASGLFADAGDAPADQAPAEATTADKDATWEPGEEARQSGLDEQAVAPEVDTEDVVGTLDEVSDASDAAPEEDFSDAFMVTPETVSRLVSRQASTAPPPADEEPEEEPVAEPTSTHQEEAFTATPSTEDAPGREREDAPGQETEEIPTEETPTEEAPTAEEAPSAESPTEEPPTAATAGAIDAPPPSIPQRSPDDAPPPVADAPATAAAGGLGITGDLVGGDFAERAEAGPVALQNSRLLRCSLGDGSGIIARQGTMVAYQGQVEFERQGAGGVTRALKRAATGEGLAMMRAEGSGDVFFADGAQHVFLLQLEGGPGLSVNGRNVLAFSAALQWDIERVKGATLLAGGLFNTTLTGTGWVALVSDGEPVVLRTDEAPTYVDVNALVAWSGGLTTRISNTVTAKSLVGLGSGEAFQMAFEGAGIVIVQPSEGPTGGPAAS